MPAATFSQSFSQSRGKRKVMSASPMRRSNRQTPELVTPRREQRARKCVGLGRLERQLFALIGRAVAKAAQRQAGRARARLRHQIARIDGLHPLHQRQRRAAGCDGDEQALVRTGRRRAELRRERHLRRRQRRPKIGEVDALLRAGVALHGHADRRRLDVECGAGDHDRQRRRVDADRRFRPARPQHIGDESDRDSDDGGEQQEWRGERTRLTPAPCCVRECCA